MIRQVQPRHLKTWKEIASHLGVSVRTAQNWESERGLPVRRVIGEKRQVRAVADELDEWLKSQEAAPSATAKPSSVVPESESARLPSWQPAHLAACCIGYALLYVLDLFLEVAYRFDTLGRSACLAALPLALWIAGSSALLLRFSVELAVRGRRTAFAVLFGGFSIAGITSGAALTLFGVLPMIPVTLLRFPSQPAAVAYFKNVVFYFLPLATTVWLVPFHFVGSVHRQLQQGPTSAVIRLLDGQAPPAGGLGALRLPINWLVVGMFVAGLVSVVLTQDLLRNLQPARHANLFMVLAITKSACYFALGMLCIAWYARALRALRLAASTSA